MSGFLKSNPKITFYDTKISKNPMNGGKKSKKRESNKRFNKRKSKTRKSNKRSKRSRR